MRIQQISKRIKHQAGAPPLGASQNMRTMGDDQICASSNGSVRECNRIPAVHTKKELASVAGTLCSNPFGAYVRCHREPRPSRGGPLNMSPNGNEIASIYPP